VEAEHRRGPDLEELVERAESTREGEKRVRLFDHQPLAAEHAVGDHQLVGGGVRDLAVDQRLRDHAQRVRAAGPGAIGHRAHHADAAAAGDQRVAAPGDLPAGRVGEVQPPLLQLP
jgi:hypothetical protein